MPDQQLIYNAIQTPDGTVLESFSVHDYKEYVDKNGKDYMVDGGLAYLRRNLHDDYKELSLTTDADISLIREKFRWGTRGKDGRQPLKRVLLKDLTDDHIFAIIETQKQLPERLLDVFHREILYRKTNLDG